MVTGREPRYVAPPQDLGEVFWHPNGLDRCANAFKKNARACGIEDSHFHNLGHTAATDILASGMGIEYIQAVFGHTSIFNCTDLYEDFSKKS